MIKFKFNPNKRLGNDGIRSDFTNGERALRGEEAVRCHPDSRRGETMPSDIVADIFHYCDREGIDVQEVIDLATMNWENER